MNFKKDGVSKDNLLSLMAKEMDVSDWPSDAEWAVCANSGYQSPCQNRVAFARYGKPRMDERDGGWTMFAHADSFVPVCDWILCDFDLPEIPYDWYNGIVSREQFMQAKKSTKTNKGEPVRTQRKFGDYVDNSKLTEAELRVFIDDAEAMGFGNDNDEAGYPFTGILGDCVGGRLGSITSDVRGNDVTHEYQGLSQQWQDNGSENVHENVHENVITETGVYPRNSRGGSPEIVINHIDFSTGKAYGIDTGDDAQEIYDVKTGCRILSTGGLGDLAGVARKDSPRKSVSDVVNVTMTFSKTPAQEQGWAVGDIGIVKTNTGFMKAGSVVELHHDDVSLCPQFEDLSSDATEFHYGNLSDIVHIGTKQQFLDMFFDTPAKRQGWGLDVYGVVTDDCFGIIQESSVVRLYKDEGDSAPLWKVLKGKSEYSHCNGHQGAYLGYHYVAKINLTADLYDKLSQ